MEAEGSRMSARKKAGGQTPEPTNRNYIGCSCGILPVAALLEFIGFHLIKNLMSAFMGEGKATLPTELLYLPLTDEALAVQHLIALIFIRWRLTATLRQEKMLCCRKTNSTDTRLMPRMVSARTGLSQK